MQKNYNKLLTYAYNIVGSYEDAKDLVQDVLEKYITLDKSSIRHESNFLIKSTINHAINFKNRQNKKEVFGEWLPEPVSFDNADAQLIREETASYTMLVLLEYLNPKERAAFVLKEGFNYSHAEIAELLEISTENSRQLLSRANKQLKDSKYPSFSPHSGHSFETVGRYQKALAQADIVELQNLLMNDIKLSADGGTKMQVVSASEIGKIATATLLVYVQQHFLMGKTFTFQFFNHQPAICFWEHEKLHNCHILQLSTDGLIQEIYSIVDPDKLKKHYQAVTYLALKLSSIERVKKMKTLLRIDSSLRLKTPIRNAGDNFVRVWKELNPEGSVSIREVGTSHIPHLEQVVLEKFYTARDTSDRLKLSDQLIAELFGCDEILITVPMYNFGIPSSLKAYFDLVLRTGKTFRCDEDKAIGLLQNKKAYVLSAMGELDSALPNLVEMHLQQILNFIGIREIYYYSLNGTDDKESVKQQLNHQKELFTNILNK